MNYKVKYFVVVSKDPEALDYYKRCDMAYMPKVIKKEFTDKDTVMVFPTSYDPKINFESTTLAPFITQEIKVPSGHRYFMTVYAKVKLQQADDASSS